MCMRDDDGGIRGGNGPSWEVSVRLRGAKMRVGVVVSMATLPRDQRALTRARAGHAQKAFGHDRGAIHTGNEASKRATDVFFWRAEVGGRGGADVDEEHDAAHSSTNTDAALCGRVQGRACVLVVCVLLFKRGVVLRAPAALTKRPIKDKNVTHHGAGDP